MAKKSGGGESQRAGMHAEGHQMGGEHAAKKQTRRRYQKPKVVEHRLDEVVRGGGSAGPDGITTQSLV